MFLSVSTQPAFVHMWYYVLQLSVVFRETIFLLQGVEFFDEKLNSLCMTWLVDHGKQVQIYNLVHSYIICRESLDWTKVPLSSCNVVGVCQFHPLASSPPPNSPPHRLIWRSSASNLSFSYREKRQYCALNETKHVYFSFFNPLKVTDELEIESLGWVHGGKLGGGELTMGRNRYKACG